MKIAATRRCCLVHCFLLAAIAAVIVGPTHAGITTQQESRTLVKGTDSQTKQSKKAKKAKKQACSDGLNNRGEYMEHARAIIMDTWLQICALEEADPTLPKSCETISDFMAIGEERYQDVLPDYYYTNYVALSVAYPVGKVATDSGSPAVFTLMATSLRIHRVLGYGNALRLLGYSEDIVQEAYWSHEDLLVDQDLNIPSNGPGLETYCGYIGAEYEQLKQFARDTYDPADLPNVITFNLDNTMVFGCQSPFAGYIVRSDWEHHRREVTASLMSSSSRGIVLYTIWHWESFFLLALGSDLETAYSAFLASFDYVVETFGV